VTIEKMKNYYSISVALEVMNSKDIHSLSIRSNIPSFAARYYSLNIVVIAAVYWLHKEKKWLLFSEEWLYFLLINLPVSNT
jgi:hypothetical protein